VGVGRPGGIGVGREENLTGHAQMDHEDIARVEGGEQVLPPARNHGDLAPLESADEVGRSAMTSHRASARHRHGRDRSSHKQRLQVAPQRLDFG
jgi:hypothetical protein